MFQSGDYELAIADINFALSLGYPEDIKYKLYDRLGRCHLKNGNPAKAKPSFLIANQLVSKCIDIEEKKRNQLLSSFNTLTNDCEKSITSCNNITTNVEKNQVPDTTVDTTDMVPSEEYPALVSKVEVRETDEVGRHVVAKESLELGDTVLVERPYAAVLYPEQNGKNCHNCFK